MSERSRARPPTRAQHPEIVRLREERQQMRREREAAVSNRDAIPLRQARADFRRQSGDSALASEGGIFAGGTEGNRRLTSQTGALLLVLLAILGVTIIRIGQLLWVHMFVGVLLLGPIALKLASTGFRFARYYTGNPRYRRVGPPPTLLRMRSLPFDGEPAWDGYGTGRAGRALAIGGVLVGGLVLALVSISWFGPWLHSFG